MPELSTEPWRRVPRGEARWMVDLFPSTAGVMAEGIRAHIPEYFRPEDATYARVLRTAVEDAASHFVRIIADPEASWGEIRQVFVDIGFGEAIEGRSLDQLQSAMRLGARVAWQHLSVEAERLGRPSVVIRNLAEAIFAYLDELASAAAEGYSRAKETAATEREHRRGRLLGLVLAEPQVPAQVIEVQAAQAGWRVPQRIAVIVLDHRDGGDGPAGLPPDFLSGIDRGSPCLVVPDPDGPGRGKSISRLLTGWVGAMGPSVPVEGAALSRLWARRTLDLVAAGVIRAADGLARADDHIPSLLLAEGGDFIRTAAARRMAPLVEAAPRNAVQLAKTLLECAKSGFNARSVADKMRVHPQTVRYRLGQLHEIFDRHFDFEDPELRAELILLLHAWIHDAAQDGQSRPLSRA